MKSWIHIIILLLTVSGGTVAQDELRFKDLTLSIDERVDFLLDELSLGEKCSQLLYQSQAIERLGISEYNWWNEALHGVGRAGRATVFPQSIGLAATFDDVLIEEVATAISDEARAKYNVAQAKGNFLQYLGLSFWSPNVNIFRDPRWGRGQETYGEDPYLTSQIGLAFVKGLQGNHPQYLKVSAGAKHFAVHNGPEESRHRFDAKPTEKDLRETYLIPFKYLVEGGVESVMCAYNRLYGEPCCGSNYLLNQILKQEWNFKGHIVSDCWALDDFWLRHKVTESQIESAILAANAGVNLNCGYIFNYLQEAVENDLLSEADIDRILKPLLRTRMKLGLLEEPGGNPYDTISGKQVNSTAHRQLALTTAEKSIVLLENKNQCLPLNLDTVQKIFVTGPLAADITALLGNYNGLSPEMVTVLEGILSNVDEGTVVDYSQGSLLNTDSVFHGEYHAFSSDVTIAVIGNSRLLEGENGDAMLSKGGGDRERIELPQNQIELIRRLRKQAGQKKLIVVVMGGSAIAMPEISALADAVLFAWYPGEQGGEAIANVIFGKTNPAGRLPLTFYKSTKDLPPFEDYHMKGRTYRFFEGDVLYPFGYGMSFTQFEYQKLDIPSWHKIDEDEFEFSVEIQNKGQIDGDEVIQIYIKDTERAPNEPIQKLVFFKRLHIKAGEILQLKAKISMKDLTYWNIEDQKYKVKPGKYLFQIGSSSADIKLSKSIQLGS